MKSPIIEKVMTNMEYTILLLAVLYGGVLSSSLKSEILRKKRWDDTAGGDMSSMFRGTAGVDYPDLLTIPTTSFRCDDQIYEGGLYADVEAKCQVYHVCHEGRKDSFLCGRGTIFNQQILACDYWYSAECETAPNFYHLNSQIGNNGSGPKSNPSQAGYNSEGNTAPIYNAGNANVGGNNGQRNYQLPCRCARSSYSNPWSFPSGMMAGSADK